MSDPGPVTQVGVPPEPPPATPEGFTERLAFAQRAGGLVAPLLTVLIAFVMGGLVVLVTTGKNPLRTYEAIFNGSGLNWLFQVGSHEIGIPFTDAAVWFPWDTSFDSQAGFNLQQTLIQTTTLILVGLAVAFAFRCGLFNIGGQGQYISGAILAVWIGSSFEGLDPFPHILLALVVGTAAGALVGGVAGFLKATVGAHEVISTIMLNSTIIYIGVFLFGLGGPLQNDTQTSVPISNDIHEGAKLPVFWGDPLLQGLHIGFFIAIAALVVYWVILNRTTLGYGVKAVGFNPEAARYGGINVARNYFLAMAISGAFAGLAGAIDILGWQYRLSTGAVQGTQIAFVGIAVALLGRNTAVGTGLAALLFGALLTGTSTRNLDPAVFEPELASNLTLLIQGLVVLFVGIDMVDPLAPRPGAREADRAMTSVALPLGRIREPLKAIGWGGIALGSLAAFVALPPIAARSWVVSLVIALAAAAVGIYVLRQGERRFGWYAIVAALLGFGVGYLATRSGIGNLEAVVVWSALFAAMLRYATPLIFGALGGMFSERSGVVNVGLDGMMLMGAFFGIMGADKLDSWVLGLLVGVLSGGAMALLHAIWSIHFRADQVISGFAINFLSYGLTGYLFIDIYGQEGTPTDIPSIPNVRLAFIDDVPFFGDIFGNLNLMIWIALILVPISWIVLFKTPLGLRLRAVGEHPRAADTVGIDVYAMRYGAVVVSGMLAAAGGAFLSIGFVNSFNENMTNFRGFIALAAVIVGKWRPGGAAAACLLFGFFSALGDRLPTYSTSGAVLFEALPYVVTLIVVAGVIGRSIPPAASGRPYKKQ